jgi:hypothetical protein
MAKGAGSKNKKIKVANPMLTKNGKERLGPLNVQQLTALKNRTSKKKVQAKIQKEIERKTK